MDALGQADEQRVADQRVADRDFVEVRERTKHHEVVEVEIVAGVHAEAERVREFRGPRVLGERLLPGVAAALEGAGERLGVELHAIRADVGGPADRRLHGIDKDADAYARRASAPGRRRRRSRAACEGSQPAWLVISPGFTGTSVH